MWRPRLLLVSSLLPLVLAYGCAEKQITPAEPSVEEKLARLMRLEDARSSGGGEVYARFGDADARVRARAALAAGRLGEPEAALPLSSLLLDASAYVRATAAFSLGILEAPLPAEAELGLTEALGDANETVRGRAAEALARNGGDAAAELIAGSLAERLPTGGEPYDWSEPIATSPVQSPRLDLRLGLFALARLGDLRWAWNLIATKGETPRFLWWPAAWAASELDGDSLQPLYIFYAGSTDPVLRLFGARGLGTLGKERARDPLRMLVYDPNEKVRIEAIRSAAGLGLDELVPDLVPLLDSDTTYVRVTVLQALSRLQGSDAVDPLIDRLGSDDPWVRSLALPALARQDPEGFWLLLSGIGLDRDRQVRAAIADLLGRMAGERPSRLLRTMIEDSDARVRAHVLRALARRGGQDAVPILIEHLRAEDPFERAAAAEGLGELGAAESAGALEKAFQADGGGEPLARAAVLDALAAVDPAAAETVASGALGDESVLVRRRAAAILKRAGAAETASPASLDTERPLDDYLELATPRYTPQAFIQTGGGTIELELFVLDAPLTVANFVRLAREGFYDGLSFHEVVPNGHVRAGDPRGDGFGGPGYTIRSEINPRPFLRGTVAMFDRGKDTAGSQFFITHLPRPELEGRYTVFGHVTRGMEIVDRLEQGDVIESVTIWDGVTPPYRADAGIDE